MTVNLIVVAVTLLISAFISVWICIPRVRPWLERPKHRFLDRQRRFPAVTRCTRGTNNGT
jgi:hypothetical protein